MTTPFTVSYQGFCFRGDVMEHSINCACSTRSELNKAECGCWEGEGMVRGRTP